MLLCLVPVGESSSPFTGVIGLVCFWSSRLAFLVFLLHFFVMKGGQSLRVGGLQVGRDQRPRLVVERAHNARGNDPGPQILRLAVGTTPRTSVLTPAVVS